MGFDISWIAVRGLSLPEALARIGARDTRVPAEIPEAHLSAAELPDGWVVLYSTDFDFAVSPTVHPLFDHPVVGCQVHEGIMVSIAYGAEPGGATWGLMHEAYNGRRDLTVQGDPPPAYGAILKRGAQLQGTEGEADVDHMFDVPIETAFAVTGFRHDRWRFDWGQPAWTVAELG